MGEKKHRERVNNFLQVNQMIVKGYTWVEIVGSIGKNPSYIRGLIHGKSLSVHLDSEQRKAVKYASEVANIVSGGSLTVSTIVKEDGRAFGFILDIKNNENPHGGIYGKEEKETKPNVIGYSAWCGKLGLGNISKVLKESVYYVWDYLYTIKGPKHTPLLDLNDLSLQHKSKY